MSVSQVCVGRDRSGRDQVSRSTMPSDSDHPSRTVPALLSNLSSIGESPCPLDLQCNHWGIKFRVWIPNTSQIQILTSQVMVGGIFGFRFNSWGFIFKTRV